jgi:hypothetical protein
MHTHVDKHGFVFTFKIEDNPRVVIDTEAIESFQSATQLVGFQPCVKRTVDKNRQEFLESSLEFLRGSDSFSVGSHVGRVQCYPHPSSSVLRRCSTSLEKSSSARCTRFLESR